MSRSAVSRSSSGRQHKRFHGTVFVRIVDSWRARSRVDGIDSGFRLLLVIDGPSLLDCSWGRC